MARPRTTLPPDPPDTPPDAAPDDTGDIAATAVLEAPPEALAAESSPDAESAVENRECCTLADASPAIAIGIPVAMPEQLTPAQRAFLKLQPACEVALRNVLTAEGELAEAALDAEEAKQAEKGKKTAQEAAYKALKLALMGEQQYSPTPLYDGANGSGTSVPAVSVSAPAEPTPIPANEAEWNALWEQFLDRSIDDLDVSDGMKEKLKDHKPDPITTLRSLTKLKETNPVKGYCSVKGIDEDKAEKLDNAYDKLMQAFLAEHPNPATPSPAAAPAPSPESTSGAQIDPPAGEYDFVDTFPLPVDPTPNESYSAAYHKNGIAEAITELSDISLMKAGLKAGIYKGKKLTIKTRGTLEDSLAETQFQLDESLDAFSKTFGDKAAKKLRKFIDAQVEKQASLKGGLE